MTRCSRCVLGDSVPFIEFDEQGACSYCKAHKPIVYKGEEAFRDLLEPYRRNDGRPDCIVALSGGRDSSYVLLSMVRDFGMHPLAVHYANPFSNPQVHENVMNAVRTLNLPLYTIPYPSNTHRRIFRHNLRTWLKRPALGVLPMMCLPCRALWWGVLQAARKNKIALIVSGNNRFEDNSYKKALLGIAPDESWENTYSKSFLGVIKETVRNIGYLHPAHFGTLFKSYFFGDTYAVGMRWFRKKIRIADLFYYRPWQENEILGRIQEELEWKVPADVPSTWRWDCDVAFLKDYIHMILVGATEKDDFYAKMVWEGQIGREEGLSRIEKENRLPVARIERMLEVAGYTLEEFTEELKKNYRARFGGKIHDVELTR